MTLYQSRSTMNCRCSGYVCKSNWGKYCGISENFLRNY
nr:MAG TPA: GUANGXITOXIN-1EGXTX-1E PROTEIN INHIBITOR, POTASSIUM CHANNEL [Caudoviricetes sp.]